ncbi:probable protein PAM68, chloroplastic at C-terminar half [Coccomyxa sp. Obi]|nr:probable protein PAM68, chloroplastic at C-terminar half [Coccomyxa sp. Obi]
MQPGNLYIIFPAVGDLPAKGIWFIWKAIKEGSLLYLNLHLTKKVTQQETAPGQQLSLDTEWEDQPSASTSADEEVPEEISARVLRRILIFSGIPTFTGFLSLPLFYYLKVVKHLDIPTYAVYLASFCTFGVGILGISYGAISSSWTAAEGSRLGIEEFKKNLPIAIDRMRGR